MQQDIISKIANQINSGITTEAETVYLLAEVRKLMEQDNAANDYPYLNFHCNWVLHSKLSFRFPQGILSQFLEAHFHLKAGAELSDLPEPLRSQVDRISKMEDFRNELNAFLQSHNISSLDHAYDGWARFLDLYVRVIQDVPLVLNRNADINSIPKVVVKSELAPDLNQGQQYYRIRWIITDAGNVTGEIFVINAYEV